MLFKDFGFGIFFVKQTFKSISFSSFLDVGTCVARRLLFLIFLKIINSFKKPNGSVKRPFSHFADIFLSAQFIKILGGGTEVVKRVGLKIL